MISKKEVNSHKRNIRNFIIIYFLCCVLFFCFSRNIVNAANAHTTADNSNSASVIAEGISGGVTWQIDEEGLLKLFPTNHVSGTIYPSGCRNQHPETFDRGGTLRIVDWIC